MSSQLNEAFSLVNLRRAWRWIKSNPDALFKNYYRDLYKAYAVSETENLSYLHNKLKSHHDALPALKLYFPKKSGILRPYTLLTIEDQIIYQALTNVIADNLYLKQSKYYLRNVFGNLYAGRRSQFFYKNWKRCYAAYSDAIRNAVSKGYVHAASFDLTACYDSIDYNVLKFFLLNINISQDVIDKLVNCLTSWTKPFVGDPIYQGHGIPQGPISSGLISEVVLSYFDKMSSRKIIKYFRYVDDIRIYAKNEKDLRRALVQLDVYSKKIGLFPQTGKINIHKVTDVASEIKSVSRPPEESIHPIKGNKFKAKKRLKQLSFRYEIKDDNITRFKYVLGAVTPDIEISRRLLKLIVKYPHLYLPILRYFKQYEKLPLEISKSILQIIKDEDLYYSFTAELIRTVIGRLHKRHISIYIDHIKKTTRLSLRTGIAELTAASYCFLLHHNELKYKEIQDLFINDYPCWAKVEFIRHIYYDYIGHPSAESLLNETIKFKEDDIGIMSAFVMGDRKYNMTANYRNVNNYALILLNKFGITSAKYRIPCGIEYSLKEMLGKNPIKISWKKIYCGNYTEARKRFILAKAYYLTDPNKYVQIMDTIHDALLDNLYRHDGTIGNYKFGNFGGIIPTSRFAIKYPKLFHIVASIHEARLQTKEAHFITRKTGKKTTNIKHKYVQQTRKLLIAGYEELGRLW